MSGFFFLSELVHENSWQWGVWGFFCVCFYADVTFKQLISIEMFSESDKQCDLALHWKTNEWAFNSLPESQFYF